MPPIPPDQLPLLLRFDTTQRALDCSRQHVYNLISAGLLKVVQLGRRAPRITRESVLALVAPRVETPRPPAAPSETKTLLDRALARTGGKPRKSKAQHGENATPQSP